MSGQLEPRQLIEQPPVPVQHVHAATVRNRQHRSPSRQPKGQVMNVPDNVVDVGLFTSRRGDISRPRHQTSTHVGRYSRANLQARIEVGSDRGKYPLEAMPALRGVALMVDDADQVFWSRATSSRTTQARWTQVRLASFRHAAAARQARAFSLPPLAAASHSSVVCTQLQTMIRIRDGVRTESPQQLERQPARAEARSAAPTHHAEPAYGRD